MGPAIIFVGLGALLLLAATQSDKKTPTPIPLPPHPVTPPTVPALPPPSTLPSGFPSVIPPGTPDAGSASLPEPWRTAVLTAIATGTPDQLDTLANALQAEGQSRAAAEVRGRADFLRAGGSTPTAPTLAPIAPIPHPVAPTAPNDITFDTNPGFGGGDRQWTYSVVPGDTSITIARKVIGDETRYPELILANGWKANNGLAYPTLEFASLEPGDRLYVPKSWDQYIDFVGKYNGTGIPLANPALSSPHPPLHHL